MNREIVLATRSQGKLRELRDLFAAEGIGTVDLDVLGIPEGADEELVESGTTFEENALAKARHFWALVGRPVVADDSGLEVLALGGAPGVRSRRWSARSGLGGQALDDANNERLLRELAKVGDRRARYVCVAAYVGDGKELTRRGEAAGHILTSARGTGGFGYDPYFQSDELGKTFAEATLVEKATVSHRGRAFRALLEAVGGLG